MRKSTIIAILLSLNSIFFILSLLNIFILSFNANYIYTSRGVGFILLLSTFLGFYYKNIKIPKTYIVLLLLGSLQLFIFVKINKPYIDFLLLLNFSLIFYNLSVEARNVFLKITGYSYFVILFIFLVLYTLGINIYSIEDYEGLNNTTLVSSIGFKNANNFSYLIFVVVLLFLSINNIWMLTITAVISIYTFFITGTQSTMISLFLLIAYYLTIRFSKGVLNKSYLIPILSLIIIIFSLYYSSIFFLAQSFGTLVPRVNDLIEFQSIIKSDYKTLLFGGIEARYDCFYTNFILGQGIFTFIFLAIVCVSTLNKSIKKNDHFTYFIVMIILLLGTIENVLFSASPLSIIFVSSLFSYEKIQFSNPKLLSA